MPYGTNSYEEQSGHSDKGMLSNGWCPEGDNNPNKLLFLLWVSKIKVGTKVMDIN